MPHQPTNFRNKDARSVLQCWDLLGFAKPGRKPTILEETKHQTVAHFQNNCLPIVFNLYSNVCKCPSWQMGDTAVAWFEFYVKSRTGGFVCGRRYHRLWRVYHSYKPIQRTAMLLQCCNIHLFSCTCKSAVADCGTINYLTRH